MISKEDLLVLATKEFATTKKMMTAFPENKADFKPHDRSSDVVKLMSTFVFEMYLTESYLLKQPLDRNKFMEYKPENVATIVKDFEKESSHILASVEKLTEDDLQKTLEFGKATFSGAEFFHMMIHDQIHHRGQLSVYVRMAGGLVPSVYGPSADDPSTNL